MSAHLIPQHQFEYDKIILTRQEAQREFHYAIERARTSKHTWTRHEIAHLGNIMRKAGIRPESMFQL